MNVPDDFGHWLAGFIDGEGCFQIRERSRSDRGPHFEFRFEMSLRADDVGVLREIQHRTGIGTLRSKNYSGNDGVARRPQVAWEVVRKADCLVIVAFLDQFQLRAKKRHDYAIWREAVLVWSRMRGTGNDWSAIRTYRDALVAGRAFEEPTLDEEPVAPQLRLVS